MKENLGKSFGKLLNDRFINIEGVLVEKQGEGFRFRGQYFKTRAAVKEQIFRDGQVIKNSIKDK